MTTLVFSPAPSPVGTRTPELKPGECALSGVTGYYPPAVVFPQSWDLMPQLTDQRALVSFDVLAKHGYYEAVAHHRIGAAAAAADVPDNLFELDGNAVVTVGERRVRAGELQRELRGKALAAAGAPNKAVAPRATRAATSIATPAAPVTDPRTSEGASSLHAAQAGAAASMDCRNNGPRVNNTQVRLMPGQRLSIAGSCFGASGSVEIYGSFPAPGSTLRLSPTRWTISGIDALVPAMSGVTDQTVTVTVVRADGRRSTGVAFPFRAARERRRVPAGNWIPTASPNATTIKEGDADLFASAQEDRRYNSAHSRPGGFKVSASVVVNPACTLEELEYTWRGAQLFTVQEWGESAVANEGRVTLTGRASCTSTQTNTLYVSREWKQVCSFAADFATWASCPVGIGP